MAQTHIHRRFAWQAWHLWYWVAPLGPDLAPVTPRHFAWQAWHNLTSTVVSRGRRGTNSHPPSFCVAGVALMVLGGALGPGFGACDAASLCVAGVAQPHIHRRFTWQAWHSSLSHTTLSVTPWVICTHQALSLHGMFRLSVFTAPSLCGVLVFDTQLCHTPSLTHHLSHTTLSHTTLSHTIFHHTIFHTPSFSTPFFTHNFDFVTHHL